MCCCGWRPLTRHAQRVLDAIIKRVTLPAQRNTRIRQFAKPPAPGCELARTFEHPTPGVTIWIEAAPGRRPLRGDVRKALAVGSAHHKIRNTALPAATV